MPLPPFDISSPSTHSKPVGMASICRDEDNTMATHLCDERQQQQQCEYVSETRDLTIGSTVSSLALKSNSSLLTSTEARSPLMQQGLSTLQGEDFDSGIFELTKLNR